MLILVKHRLPPSWDGVAVTWRPFEPSAAGRRTGTARPVTAFRRGIRMRATATKRKPLRSPLNAPTWINYSQRRRTMMTNGSEHTPEHPTGTDYKALVERVRDPYVSTDALHRDLADAVGTAVSDEEAEKPETVVERAWREHPDEMARAHTEFQVSALRERVAELEAEVQRVYKMAHDDDPAAWHAHQALIQLICDPDEPSTVLAAVKRETAAQALEPILEAERTWRLRRAGGTRDLGFRAQVLKALRAYRSGTEAETGHN